MEFVYPYPADPKQSIVSVLSTALTNGDQVRISMNLTASVTVHLNLTGLSDAEITLDGTPTRTPLTLEAGTYQISITLGKPPEDPDGKYPVAS